MSKKILLFIACGLLAVVFLYAAVLFVGPDQPAYDTMGRRIADPNRSPAQPVEGIGSGRVGVAHHAPRTVNIRSSPSTTSSVASQLAAGEVAYLGTPKDGWAAVYSGGDTVGFVFAGLLRPGYAQKELEPTRAKGRPRSAQVAIRVSAFNWTEQTIRGKTEVWLRGQGSWFPDLKYGGDVTTFEGRLVGSVDSLFFYPFGRNGPEMMVAIEIDSELCRQGCPRDMINFEVWPERFLAWGSPIEGHEIAMKR